MRTVSFATISFLIPPLVLMSEPADAHENTLAAYVASLEEDSKGSPVQEKPDALPTCRLTIELVNAATKRPTAGMVRIKRADGTVLPVDGLYRRGRGLRRNHTAWQWGIVLEPVTVSVPQEPLSIEALAGLETEWTSHTIDLTDKPAAQLILPLVRFYDASKEGLTSGNTHLHLRIFTRDEAHEYLQTVTRADGTDLVFVSYLRRVKAEKGYISNTYTKETLQTLSDYGIRFDFGEEHRHNFGPGGEGYGHVMFLNIKKLIRPVSIGPGIMGTGVDSPPIRRGIEEARRDGATVLWCHNALGFEDVPNWLAGTVDAQNIFDGGNVGGYEETYYRYMNVGLRVPFSTGTDWFIFDFSRVYVRTGHPVTIPTWLDGLKAGRSFITNGPMLELEVDGRRPGDTIRLDRPTGVKVRARATGRSDFSKIELVSGGRVVLSAVSRPVGGHFEAVIDKSLEIEEPGWIALRVATTNKNALGNPLFAHTSAVYVEMAGRPVFKPDAARRLIADMEDAILAIQSQATFADDRQRDEVLGIYRQGIATLEKRLAP